jgi:hypothetical protein
VVQESWTTGTNNKGLLVRSWNIKQALVGRLTIFVDVEVAWSDADFEVADALQ